LHFCIVFFNFLASKYWIDFLFFRSLLKSDNLLFLLFSCAPLRVADRDVEKRQESPAGPLEVFNFHGNNIETSRFPALFRHRCSRHVPLTFTRTYVYVNTRRSVFFSFKEDFQSIIPSVFHQKKKIEKKTRLYMRNSEVIKSMCVLHLYVSCSHWKTTHVCIPSHVSIGRN